MNTKGSNITYPGAVLILILLFILAAWICGCSAVKKVISNPKKLEQVGRVWEKENPCVNDTTIIINGQETVKYDTVYNNKDSIIFSNDTTILIKRFQVTKTVVRKDTVKSVVEDTRRINLLQKDISFRDGQIEVLMANVSKERKRGNKWMYFFFGSIALGLVRIFIKYRYKIGWL